MAMIRCPKCNQVHAINRSGIVRGRQRYYCKECVLYFTLKEEAQTVIENTSLKKKMATLADIANALHISKSTVSRALQGHSDIKPQTRNAVMDMAKQLDYTPNLLAQSLVRKRSNTIGIIVPELVSYFFSTIIIGATDVANEAGYNIVICQSQEELKTEIANVNVLLASRVDGILVSVTKETKNYDHFKSLQKHDIPVVFYNRVCNDMDCKKVLVDDYDGAFKATRHLIQSGYKKIAHIAGPPALYLSMSRLNGYRDALKKYKLPYKKQFVIHTDLSVEGANRSALKLLSLKPRPDAVFCVNDPTAIQLMMLAKSRHIIIPDELGIAGFSNDPIAAIIEPGLTTVAQPVLELGQLAMKTLLAKIKNPAEENGLEKTLLKAELIIRSSSTPKKP